MINSILTTPTPSLLQLLDSKHPTAWVEFELGQITEAELFAKFFKDGRPIDQKAFLDVVIDAYEYLDGMELLLKRLFEAGHDVHSFSNYPSWHQYIENKLQLSRYLEWTFVSCTGPMKGLRKPSQECFDAVIAHIGRPAEDIIFVDDRLVNVEAARAAGLRAVHFQNAANLEEELKEMGVMM